MKKHMDKAIATCAARKQRRARAFTLIELSIVLVIIGLIVGGVLVGRDLIEAAQIRKVVSTLQQIDTKTFSMLKRPMHSV